MENVNQSEQEYIKRNVAVYVKPIFYYINRTVIEGLCQDQHKTYEEVKSFLVRLNICWIDKINECLNIFPQYLEKEVLGEETKARYFKVIDRVMNPLEVTFSRNGIIAVLDSINRFEYNND